MSISAFVRKGKPLRGAASAVFGASHSSDRPRRGALMQAMLAHAIPLSVPYERIAALPAKEWDPVWFDAHNPRGFVPISNVLMALRAMDRDKPVLDALRDAVARGDLAELPVRLASGAYAWGPALAHLLDSVDDATLASVSRSALGAEGERRVRAALGTGETSAPAAAREFVLRSVLRIEDVLIDAVEGSDGVAHLARVLRAIVIASRARLGLADDGPGGQKLQPVLSTGLIGAVVSLPSHSDAALLASGLGGALPPFLAAWKKSLLS